MRVRKSFSANSEEGWDKVETSIANMVTGASSGSWGCQTMPAASHVTAGDYAIALPQTDGQWDPSKGRGSWHYDLFQLSHLSL